VLNVIAMEQMKRPPERIERLAELRRARGGFRFQVVPGRNRPSTRFRKNRLAIVHEGDVTFAAVSPLVR